MKISRINAIIGNSLAFLLLTSQMGIAIDREALKYNAQAKALAARSTTAPELKSALNDHVIQGVESSNESIKETALEKSAVILEDSSSWTSSSAMDQTQKLVEKVSKAKKAPGHPEDKSDSSRFSKSIAKGLKIAEEAKALPDQISSEMVKIVNEGLTSTDESIQTAYQQVLPSFYESVQNTLSHTDSQDREPAKDSIKLFENFNKAIDEKKVKIEGQAAQKIKGEMALTVSALVAKEAKKNKVKKDKVSPNEHPSSEEYFNSEQYPNSDALASSVVFLTHLGQSTIFDEGLKLDILNNLEAIKQSGNKVDDDALLSLVDTLNDNVPFDASSLFGDEDFYGNEKAALIETKSGMDNIEQINVNNENTFAGHLDSIPYNKLKKIKEYVDRKSFPVDIYGLTNATIMLTSPSHPTTTFISFDRREYKNLYEIGEKSIKTIWGPDLRGLKNLLGVRISSEYDGVTLDLDEKTHWSADFELYIPNDCSPFVLKLDLMAEEGQISRRYTFENILQLKGIGVQFSGN